MFRISDLIDLPIITIKEQPNAKHFVKSVLLDGQKNRVAALVCKESQIKKYMKIIPYENIISVDINRVIVSDINCMRKISSKGLENLLLMDDVINKSIRSNTGDFEGVLTDLYINLLNGKIISFELSEGYIDDLMRGRKIIGFEDALNNNLSNNEITLYQRLN